MKLMLERFIFLSLVVLSTLSCLSARTAEPRLNNDASSASWSLEQKIGQLLLLGYDGAQFEDGLLKKVSYFKPGGILVFKRNILSFEQIRENNQQLQIYAKRNHLPKFFISVDQEGGDVSRLPFHPHMPSHATLAQSNSKSAIYSFSLSVAKILKALSFNMVLAPVLDVQDPTAPSFLGRRSFSGNAHTVANASLQILSAYQHANLLSVAKHFPGHGAANGDSHFSLPISQASRADLFSKDLVPYRLANSFSSLPALMAAHVAFPKVTGNLSPATFSKKILHDVLRSDLNFKGLVITDDLSMDGASSNQDIGENAVRAIEAGADMILLAWSTRHQLASYHALIKAVKTKRISMERIDQSLTRIAKAKAALDSESTDEDLTFSEYRTSLSNVLNQIYRSSLEKVRTEMKMVPDKQIYVFHAKTKSDCSLLNSMPQQEKRRLVVINSTLPSFLVAPSEFRAIVPLYYNDSHYKDHVSLLLPNTRVLDYGYRN